jgi:hypothetical protein
MPTPLPPPSLESVIQGLHDSEIRCGIQNEPPAGGITAWIDYGSRTERLPSTGLSLAIVRSGRRPIASRRGCTRLHCAFSQIAPMPKRTPVDRQAPAVRRKVKSPASVLEAAHPPVWIEPQLTRLADEAPEGSDWLHEIKYNGYRMHGRLDRGEVQDRLRRDR